MIYVHVPFCRSFCTYCGFYSCAVAPTIPLHPRGTGGGPPDTPCVASLPNPQIQAYVDEVCREALDRKNEIAATAAVDTLYFGGGTPSVLPLSYLGRIADACGGRRYKEWTVELNPDDVTPEYARGLRELGVNRASMGVQSLDDGMLRLMNRRHDSDGARRAFGALREAGFDNVSVDIIFGVGGMTDAMLEATVREILEWRPEHISAYQLSIEEGSALEELLRTGRYTELPDEDCARQYYLICSLLHDAGYEHYEISNWALPGKRAVHNSAYWTRAPYVGLGPGAHSLTHPHQRITTIPLHPKTSPNVRSWNSEVLSGWTSKCEVLTAEQIREEEIMLGLRTADGVPAELLAGGVLVPSVVPGRVRIPEDRWFVADDIIASLI